MFPRDIFDGDLPFNAAGMAVYPDGTGNGAPVSSASAGLTYALRVAALNPLLWLRLRETSGTSVTNSGSVSVSGTWTPGAGALNQTGQLGAGEAYEYDGADSKIQFAIASIAAIANLTTQRWAFLYNADTLGEATASFFFGWGTSGSAHQLRFLSANRLTATIQTGTTSAAVTTDVDQVADIIGAWRWIFMDYDDADSLGNGRRIRLWKSTPGSGVVTALTLGGGNVAATGTVTVQSADLCIGNLTSQIRTLDGKLDEVICGGASLWTTAEMQDISRLS